MKNYSQTLLLPFSIIFLVNIIFYLPIILSFPGFIYDDYSVFAMVSNSHQLISTNPNEIFFFFVRPLSYLTFKLDYLLWGNNFLGMKLFTLVLQIVFMCTFFLILKTISELRHKKFNMWLALLPAIVFSIHPASLIWIYWISNRTELLGLLFYSASMLFFLKYFLKQKSYYLIFVIIFYIFSILSKQQGIHLPLLFIFALLFLKFIPKKRKKSVFVSVAVCTVLMLSYSVLNYFLFGSTLDLALHIFKKPLSLIGNILHAVFPIASQNIYNFFLLNKTLALMALMALAIILIVTIFVKKVRLKSILLTMLFIFVIFYPRILAVGNIRVNGIIVFWVMIGLYLLLTEFNIKDKLLIPLISVILAISIFTFIVTAANHFQVIKNYKKQQEQLANILKDNENASVFSDHYYETLQPEIYYYKNKTFGVDSTFKALPIFFDRKLKSNYNFDEMLIDITSENDGLKIRSLDPLIYLSYNLDKTIEEGIKIFETKQSFSGRDYSYIKLILPKNYADYLIYFNGGNWEKINLKR